MSKGRRHKYYICLRDTETQLSTTPIEALQESLKVIQPCDEVVGTGPAFVQRHGNRDEMSIDKDKFILSQNVVGSNENMADINTMNFPSFVHTWCSMSFKF